MPPKKGKGKDGKKAKGPPGEKKPKLKKVPEGLHTSEMSKRMLMTFIKRLLAERDRETMERNLFMLEKSKLFTMWNMVIERVHVLTDEARNSEVRRDIAEKGRDKERECADQKLRMLQTEQLKNFGFIRLHHLNYMKNLSDEVWAIENILRESAVGKRMQIRSQLRAQYEILRGFHMKHGQSLSNMLIALSQSVRSKEGVWERLFDSRKESSTLRLTEKDNQIASKRLSTLDSMDETHERLMQDCQTFFNDMTASNFAVISSLQQEIDELKDENRRLSRDLADAKLNYYSTTAPLESMQTELLVWESDPKSLDEMHSECSDVQKILRQKNTCIENLDLMIEILVQRIKMAKTNLENVKSTFIKGFLKIQQQVSMDHVVTNLREKAARRDLKILDAVSTSRKSASIGPLRTLRNSIDQVHMNVRQDVDKINPYPSCGVPGTVDNEMKHYGEGLMNRDGAILPPISAIIQPKFQGKAQRIQTRIKYIGGDQRDPLPMPGAKKLGYGYCYMPEGKLGSVEFKSTPMRRIPPMQEFDDDEEEEEYEEGSEMVHSGCRSIQPSEYFRVSGRPTSLPPIQTDASSNDMHRSRHCNSIRVIKPILEPKIQWRSHLSIKSYVVGAQDE